jgi:hypothetical protein
MAACGPTSDRALSITLANPCRGYSVPSLRDAKWTTLTSVSNGRLVEDAEKLWGELGELK